MTLRSIKSDGRPLAIQIAKKICILLVNTNKSNREIAKVCDVSRNSVFRLKCKIISLGVKQASEITELTDKEFFQKFYPGITEKVCRVDTSKTLYPNFKRYAALQLETKKTTNDMYNQYVNEATSQNLKSLSLQYFYSCIKEELDKIKQSAPDYYLAQDFQYGNYLQVDFSGDVYKVNTFNGELNCCLMVLCWPASYYVYAEFVTGQTTAESCRVIANAIQKYGNRIPALLTVDNAKCFVTKHSGSEAIINKNFDEYMQSLNICVEAAPPYRPQRKSAVEYSVRLVQNMMCSIKSVFADTKKTLTEHNQLLQEHIDNTINKGPFRKDCNKTRDYLFRMYELPACMMIPKVPPYIGNISSAVVPRSYLVVVNQHEYSVPYLYIRKKVDIYVDNETVVIKYEGKEIARHIRTDGVGRTIIQEHMPQEHQNIVAKQKMYQTTDDVLNVAKTLDDGVYRFCLSKIKYDTEHSSARNPNTIKCCVAIINAYKRAPVKELFAEACDSTLNLPPELWNSYKVRELYDQVLREYSSSKNQTVAHQTEIYIPNEEDAFIRDYGSDGSAAQSTNDELKKLD